MAASILAYAHFFAENWVEAAVAARKASQANPEFSVLSYLLTGALIRLGRISDAAASSKRVLELQSSFTVSGLVSGGITTPERIANLAEALLEAGLPE